MTYAAFEQVPEASHRWAFLRPLRRSLDAIYLVSGYAAAICMVMILVVTMAQIMTRYAGVNVRGLSDYAGYFMAASAFLAFPLALNRGAHVRIELALGAMGRFRHVGELVAFGISTLVAGWFAYYACAMVYWSWKFGDLSTGLDATPLWIPQSTMAIGAVLFAIAIFDQFLQLALTGRHSVATSAGIE